LVDIEHRLVTVPGVPGQERLHPQAQVRRRARADVTCLAAAEGPVRTWWSSRRRPRWSGR
jgi:hypothetical protein